MAVSPESLREKPIDFRAPPPSPVAAGRRSSVRNDDVLTEFLEHSLRVPDLILPDRVFPRQKSSQDPPRIDLDSLGLSGNESMGDILESIGQMGFCELVNHGIEIDLIRSVAKAGGGIFQISPELKGKVSRSAEKAYGFVETHSGEGEEEERETSEEFVWSRDEDLKVEMEGIWPAAYSNFSEKMEKVLSKIEDVAGKFIEILRPLNTERKWNYKEDYYGMMTKDEQVVGGSICYLYKHTENMMRSADDEDDKSLKYDVIRMLIRGSEYSHALCLHVCPRPSSEFHVYSKKGWISFCPHKDAILITIGDQLQAWSGGKYKHVIGRAIFKGDEEEEGECISMAFLYSPPTTSLLPNIISAGGAVKGNMGNKTISLGQQIIIFALILNLVYQFFMYIYAN